MAIARSDEPLRRAERIGRNGVAFLEHHAAEVEAAADVITTLLCGLRTAQIELLDYRMTDEVLEEFLRHQSGRRSCSLQAGSLPCVASARSTSHA